MIKYRCFVSIVLSVIVFSCESSDEPCQNKTWYFDQDGDGLGSKEKFYESCDKPIGYVDNANDDNDLPPAPSIIPSKGFSTPSSYPNLKLLWSDEFEGTALDEKKWNYEAGDGCPGNCGWGNNELQFYKKENTTVKDGYLLIQAKKENIANKEYTSSRLTTQNKFNFKYGRVDIRAALPKGKGIWPALWMLGKNINEVSWPKCGEIDIMEMIGGPDNDNTVHGTVHWDHNNSHAQYGGSKKLSNGIFNGEFHVFSIVWDSKKIVWYLDDVQFHVIDTTPSGLSEFQEEFFLLFNVAVGGNWPGSPDSATTFPQYMVVDYVRVFN
jgi:beta-glucanase (GH16 family)